MAGSGRSGVGMSLESSLIRLAAAGDRDAQRLVYESLKDRLYRLIVRIVGPTEADEGPG